MPAAYPPYIPLHKCPAPEVWQFKVAGQTDWQDISEGMRFLYDPGMKSCMLSFRRKPTKTDAEIMEEARRWMNTPLGCESLQERFRVLVGILKGDF